MHTTTNRISASSSASEPSASSFLLVFSPNRWLISRASSPTSSASRARFVSGEKYPSLYWPIQRSTISWVSVGFRARTREAPGNRECRPAAARGPVPRRAVCRDGSAECAHRTAVRRDLTGGARGLRRSGPPQYRPPHPAGSVGRPGPVRQRRRATGRVAARGRAPAGPGGRRIRRRAGLRAAFWRAPHSTGDVRRGAGGAVRDAPGATPRADALRPQGRPARAPTGDAHQSRVHLSARSRRRPRARAGARAGGAWSAGRARRARWRGPPAVARGRSQGGRARGPGGPGAALHRRRPSPLRDRGRIRAGGPPGRPGALVHRLPRRRRAGDPPHAPHRVRSRSGRREADRAVARVVRGRACGALHGPDRATRRVGPRSHRVHRRVPRGLRRHPRRGSR